MAAITVSALSVLSAGDHVVAAKVLYGGTYIFFHDELPKRGVSTTFVDVSNLEEVRAAMGPNTRLLYC
jgi:O-acetylhomoserine/O-acetylserine sulfhydrylase-like pyridoxal-dependent enzyme